MKSVFSIFLLIIMMTNVSVTYMQQVKLGFKYELKESNTDDADENIEVEKEKGKEVYHSNHLNFDDHLFNLAYIKNIIVCSNDHLFSERHTFLPELPPEA